MKILVKSRNFIGYPESEYLEPDALGWMEEVLDNVGNYAEVIPTVTINIPTFVDLPWYVGGTHHSESAILLRLPLSGGSMPFMPTGGKGVSMKSSFHSTLGESFERFLALLSGATLNERELIYASYNELEEKKIPALGPDQLYFFHHEQYSAPDFLFVPFSRDLKLTWLQGKHLLTNEKVWAPAQLVAFGFRRQKDEMPIVYASSAGLSASVNIKEAILHGFLEYIERDANNLRWVSKIPPFRVNLSLEQALKILDYHLPYYNKFVKLDVFLWPTDISRVCVISTHLLCDSLKEFKYWPGIGVGLDFVSALKGALGESAQAQLFIPVMYSMKQAFGKHPTFYYVKENEDPRNVDNLFKTIFYYGYRENLQRIYSDFFGKAEVIQLDDLGKFGIPLSLNRDLDARIELIKDIAARHQLNPVVFMVGPKEISQNVPITKLIIPELTPYYVIRFPLFGHPRYYNAPKLLGVGDRTLTYHELNHDPLPYP